MLASSLGFLRKSLHHPSRVAAEAALGQKRQQLFRQTSFARPVFRLLTADERIAGRLDHAEDIAQVLALA